MSIERLIASIPTKSESERNAMRDNASRLLESGTIEQKGQAQRLLDALQDYENQERSALSARVQGLSKAQRIVEAFRARPMTETDRQVVQALLDHPGANSTILSQALGWGRMAWQMHFGKMCEARKDRLWPAPFAEKRNADFYSGILADFDDETSGFTMKPEAVEAFSALGLRPKT